MLKSQDGGPERDEIPLNRAGDLAVRRVEVAVREPIAHPSDVAPRMTGFGGEDLGRDALDGLADLDQPDAHRVEDQPIRQNASCHVVVDRVDSVEHVMESLRVPTAHSGTASTRASA